MRVDQKLVEIGYKSDSKFLNRCNLMSMGKKSYGHGFVFRVDPLPSGYGGGGGGGWRQKIASMRLKIGQGVA